MSPPDQKGHPVHLALPPRSPDIRALASPNATVDRGGPVILDKVRRNITYGNVTATLALLLATGGSAYALVSGSVESRHIADNAVRSRHIAPNEATGADVDEGSLKGIGAGVLGGDWTLPQGFAGQINGVGLSPLYFDDGTGHGPSILAPTDLVITDFRVKIFDPQPQGTRTFHVSGDGFGINGTSRKLCEINTGENGCRSDERIEIEAGRRFRFWVWYENLSGPADASFGYRIVTP